MSISLLFNTFASADNFFASNNASQIIAQWATANDNADNGVADGSIDGVADATSTATANGLSYTKESYKNANGNVVTINNLVVNEGSTLTLGQGTYVLGDVEGEITASPNANVIVTGEKKPEGYVERERRPRPERPERPMRGDRPMRGERGERGERRPRPNFGNHENAENNEGAE